MQRQEPSGAELRQRYLRLALINIASNLTVPLAGLVDTGMLGHLSDVRFLAGVGLASLVFDYVYWGFGFLRMGTTGTTAQAVGRDDRAETFHILHRSLLLALIVGGGLLLLQWPLREVGFLLLSGESGVEQAGRDYYDARIWGAPATLANFVLIGWFLGREKPRQVLAMTVVANLANIALNYLFIIRLGLAARGAGLATMLAQYLMLGVALACFLAEDRAARWSWSAVLDRRRLGELMRLNGDILVRTICLITSFALFTNFSSVLGTRILAANLLLQRWLSLAAYLIDGAAFATETLAGLFRGRRDLSSLRRTIRMSLRTGLFFAVACLVAFFAAPRTMLGLLTNHTELIDLGARYAPWLVPTLLFGSLAYMYDGLFLGLTEGRRLRNAMLISTLAFFLPASLAALWLRNNDLLWAALTLFMAARVWTLWRETRRLEPG